VLKLERVEKEESRTRREKEKKRTRCQSPAKKAKEGGSRENFQIGIVKKNRFHASISQGRKKKGNKLYPMGGRGKELDNFQMPC